MFKGSFIDRGFIFSIIVIDTDLVHFEQIENKHLKLGAVIQQFALV